MDPAQKLDSLSENLQEPSELDGLHGGNGPSGELCGGHRPSVEILGGHRPSDDFRGGNRPADFDELDREHSHAELGELDGGNRP